MPSTRTEITEIVTGLAMLDYPNVEEAIAAEPPQLINVKASHWTSLRNALRSGLYTTEFDGAWENGKTFLGANDGLRCRKPMSIEWKGPHLPPGYDFLPADLRVDHVFLISCKYLSKILANPSPSHLFDRAMSARGKRAELDWYSDVAPLAYQKFYSAVRNELPAAFGLPPTVGDLQPIQREALKLACAGRWPTSLESAYRSFSSAVSIESAIRWRDAIARSGGAEEMLWRMLRFNSAPYFILGTAKAATLRLRIATPWDWRQLFRLINFSVEAESVGLPLVRWKAEVAEKNSGIHHQVLGHVEIRWSHGRFCGSPEAKLYLDTPHHEVPGYFPIV